MRACSGVLPSFSAAQRPKSLLRRASARNCSSSSWTKVFSKVSSRLSKVLIFRPQGFRLPRPHHGGLQGIYLDLGKNPRAEPPNAARRGAVAPWGVDAARLGQNRWTADDSV